MVNRTTSHSIKLFLLKVLSNYWTFALLTAGFFTFWQVLKSISKFIMELHPLQCLFLRESNKKQRRDKIISNFIKVDTFHLLWQLSAPGGNFTIWSPSCTLLKRFSSPSSLFFWTRKRTYLDNQLERELTDLSLKLPGCSLFPQTEYE